VSRPVLAALSGISKRYGERSALAGFSLAVHAGEVVGLLGTNGAGKTTALRILCGLIEPDEGTVEIGGLDLHRAPIESRRLLGYIPDGAPLYSNLTPSEHLSLVSNLHELEPSHAKAETDRLLEAFELAERRNDPIGGFSRGMRQKVAIACALLPRPPLLVMDEPLTGLDTASALVIKALLRGWAERGGAVLVTSHLLEIVEQVCDRMILLMAGRTLAEGSLSDLRRQAGGGNSLEDVFRSLTRTEDPAKTAARILGV
jgi:ABC-2 type transport system ATP-binding protein